jgi:hypothetical protein
LIKPEYGARSACPGRPTSLVDIGANRGHSIAAPN